MNFAMLLFGFANIMCVIGMQKKLMPLKQMLKTSANIKDVEHIIMACGEVNHGNTSGEVQHAGSRSGGVTYSLHLSLPQDVMLDSCNSGYDTYIRVFEDIGNWESRESGQEVCGCDDCGPCGFQAILECTLNAGDYIVVIEGYSDEEGAYILDTTCTPPAYTQNTLSSCSANPLYQLDGVRGYADYYEAVDACNADLLCGGFQDRACNAQRDGDDDYFLCPLLDDGAQWTDSSNSCVYEKPAAPPTPSPTPCVPDSWGYC